MQREQSVHEGARHVARTRMHDETRRLVDDEHVVVLEDTRHDNRRIPSRCRGPVGIRAADLDASALVDTGRALDRHGAVHRDAARADERAGLGSCAFEQHGHYPIEALAGERAGNGRLRAHHGARATTKMIRSPPMLTAASATLNTGHHCRSTKSMTAPPRKPLPSRKMRSARLPAAPPSTSPSATAPTCVSTARPNASSPMTTAMA